MLTMENKFALIEMAGLKIEPFKGKVNYRGKRTEIDGYRLSENGKVVSYFIQDGSNKVEIYKDQSESQHTTSYGKTLNLTDLHNDLAHRAVLRLMDAMQEERNRR